MEINGVTRVNMTGAEIEAALMKARDLPTATELQQQFSDMGEATQQQFTDMGVEMRQGFGSVAAEMATKATKTELNEGLASKQDTLEFATDADIEREFGSN